jgi:Leucine-rich repeat (LRR) protein
MRLGADATDVNCIFATRAADYICAVRGDMTALSKTTIGESFSFSGDDSQKARTTWIEFTRAGRVAHLPDNVIEEFPKTTILSIVDSELPIVKNELLNEQFNRLQKLNLFSNKIQIIEEKAFAHLVNLQGIFLHNNKIQSLSGRVFKSNPNLKWISLMKNKIIMIHSDTFKNLNDLENVKLHGNKCFNQDIGCMNCRKKIDPENLDRKLRACYSNYRKSFNLLKEGRR